jgi:prepilin-type N-terminal cleavage/methylation domain-containing protein
MRHASGHASEGSSGFTLVELMVSMALMLVILGATVGALTNSLRAVEGVTLLADTQENLRAGMNYLVRDLVQTGVGLPQTGITLPNTAGVSAVTRPGPYTAPATSFGTFPTAWTVLPDISPGFQIGSTTNTSGVNTDLINVIYADNTLADANLHWLNEFPINTPGGGVGCAGATQTPRGTIVTAGTTTTITFDSTCININTGNTALAAGDLLLLQANGGAMALVVVSTVNLPGDTITLATSDPFVLNNSGKTSGTIKQIQSPANSGTYTTTTATRVWMITYYIDTSTPLRPQLMREVNLRPALAVGDVIENLQFTYDILNVGSTLPSVTTNVTNPTVAQIPYIRDAYVSLFARSENPYSQTKAYFRNNLETAVSIRSLNFFNEFK